MPLVHALVGGLFWFYHVLSSTAQFCRFSLLKPFLTFKSHITGFLLAQNVATASKIDWSIYLFTQKPFISSYFCLEWYFTYCVARNLGLTDLGLGKTLTVNMLSLVESFTILLQYPYFVQLDKYLKIRCRHVSAEPTPAALYNKKSWWMILDNLRDQSKGTSRRQRKMSFMLWNILASCINMYSNASSALLSLFCTGNGNPFVEQPFWEMCNKI